MDINKLLHFRTVVETQNIRKASELLGMTPGALSKSIRVFQEEININLIEAYGRGIIITEDGNKLYQKSHRLIEELNYLKRNLNNSIEKEIKLGTYEVFSTHFLSDFIRKEKIESIQCIELAPGEIEEALIKREIDFGINIVPFPHESLEHIEIGRTKLKTYCHIKSKYKEIDSSKLEYAVPITQLPSNPTQSTVIDSWPDNIQRIVKYKFNLLETALQVSSNDLSVVYCPDICVNLYNQSIKSSRQLVEHAYKKANKIMPIYLVKRKGTEENSFTKKLAKYIRLF